MLLNNAPKEWKYISTKKVYSSFFIDLYEDTLDIGGKDKTYIRGIRKDFSTIVPFISKDEILVIKSYRYIVDSIQIEVPSGYIDEGESAQQAALRELKEETGFNSRLLIPIGTYTTDYSMFNQIGNLFVAYDLVKEGKQSLGMMEEIDVQILDIKEIKNMLFGGKVMNASSVVALYRALDFHQKQI
jgi:ADP-ribose pyrophosphatase